MSDAPGAPEELLCLFREQLNIAVDDVDTNLIEQGVLDSLVLVELLMALETRYGVSIPMEYLELEHFKSVREIHALLARVRQTP